MCQPLLVAHNISFIHVLNDKPSSSSSSYDNVPALLVESPGSAGLIFLPGEACPGQVAGDLSSVPSNTEVFATPITEVFGVGVDIGVAVAAAATEWFIKATRRLSSSSALACSDARTQNITVKIVLRNIKC